MGLLAAGLVAGACTGDTGSERQSGPPSADVSPIAFDGRGGHSYAWSETVTGRAECEGVTLEVNGSPLDVPVSMNGPSFTAKVPVRPGDNELVARCETGDGVIAESEPMTFRQRLQASPTARIDVSVKEGTVVLDGRGSAASGHDASEIVDYAWSPGTYDRAGLRPRDAWSFDRAKGPRIRVEAPGEDGEYFVTLEVTDAAGRSDTSTSYFIVEDGGARAVNMMHEHPSWIDSAVIYAPIPQLWGNGGAKAVERRLPYLSELGVDALWLWPPTSLRAPGEEYAITDYFEVDPSWGSESDLLDMVDEAHRLGLYVLVDFVPNHMSSEGPYFKDAQANGRLSSYWDFFDREGGEPTHYFDWDYLPNLNYDNPEVRRMVIEAFAHWVRDIGVDGFRVDVAWGVRRRRPDFWPQWRRELKRINPDLLLLAEAPAVDPYYFSHGFDVAYDWTKQVGQWAWRSVWEFPQEAGHLLTTAVTNAGKGYAPNALVMRFINNNDTGARFVDQYGPEVTRVAATLQFTLPGVPAMFAGDEIGASYEPYSNLTRIPWRDRFRLRPLYERLIVLRHSIPALASREVDVLGVNVGSAFAYVRPAPDDGDPVLVVLNFGGKTQVKFEQSPALDDVLAASGGSMKDLLTGHSVRMANASLAMDAQSSLVLVREGD